MYCVWETSHTKPFGFNFNVDGTEFENKSINHRVIVWCIVSHNRNNLEDNARNLAFLRSSLIIPFWHTLFSRPYAAIVCQTTSARFSPECSPTISRKSRMTSSSSQSSVTYVIMMQIKAHWLLEVQQSSVRETLDSKPCRQLMSVRSKVGMAASYKLIPWWYPWCFLRLYHPFPWYGSWLLMPRVSSRCGYSG